jgi:hypothetical protein
LRDQKKCIVISQCSRERSSPLSFLFSGLSVVLDLNEPNETDGHEQ